MNYEFIILKTKNKNPLLSAPDSYRDYEVNPFHPRQK